jgi:hypothetical protein
VFIWEILEYDSGERCGPWDRCFIRELMMWKQTTSTYPYGIRDKYNDVPDAEVDNS